MTHRTYDVRVIALTLDAPIKWIDNLLSHHEVPGCTRDRQGVGRRISDLGLLAIGVVRVLSEELQIPLAAATKLVREAVTGDGIGPLRTSSGLRIDLPSHQLERDLQDRLRDALEAAPVVARGRPRKRNL